MKKLITSAALGAAIIGGAATFVALPAYAQNPGQGQAQQGQDQAKGQGEGQGQKRHRMAKAAIKTAAETIGIDAKDLVAELKTGKSVADVATEHGKSPQAVIDAIVAKINTRVDEAAAAGKISAEKAAEFKTKAPERVTTLVNAHRQPKANGNAPTGN